MVGRGQVSRDSSPPPPPQKQEKKKKIFSKTWTVSVSAGAASNVGVVGVRLLVDGANLGAEVTTAPYTVNWNTASTANGTHWITARARDAADNQTTSAVVSGDRVQRGTGHHGTDGERELPDGGRDGHGHGQRQRRRGDNVGDGGRAVSARWRQPRRGGHDGAVHGEQYAERVDP